MDYRTSHRNILLFLVLLSVLLCSPFFSYALNVEGRVFSEAGPIKGAKVYVYKNYDDLMADKPFFASNPTDEKGIYLFELPEGHGYYFIARGKENGRDFYSYLGGNPFDIQTNNIWLTFMANEVKPPVYSEGRAAIKGVVTYKGKPVKGANIFFYTLENSRFKGIGHKTEHVAENGTFDFSLTPDKYIVIARKAEGNKKIGPLNNGDLFCYYPVNPVEVKPGRTVSIEVPCCPKGDRSSFAKSAKIKTNDYLTAENLIGRNKSGVKGKVIDVKGDPVAGVYVIAYTYKGDPSSALSEFHGVHETENIGRTDEGGNYFIRLDTDGNYAFIARESLGDRPKLAETYGLYKNSFIQSVSFKRGQMVDNINIVVDKVVDRNPGKKSQIEKNKKINESMKKRKTNE